MISVKEEGLFYPAPLSLLLELLTSEPQASSNVGYTDP